MTSEIASMSEWREWGITTFRNKERENVIRITKAPLDRVLELGGGENRHPDADVMSDSRMCVGVDFVSDFNKPLPIGDNDFTVVMAWYVLEHISWRGCEQFLQEVLRVLKPGGSFLFSCPNTAAQIQWIKDHPNGWDNRSFFESASGVLFGDQDYPENSHRMYLDADFVSAALVSLGFESIVVELFGERKTDLFVTAKKPSKIVSPESEVQKQVNTQQNKENAAETILDAANAVQEQVAQQNEQVMQKLDAKPSIEGVSREQLYSKDYFNGGHNFGGYAREGYWDYPIHWVTFQHVMARKPLNVLEIGAARGYIGKRLEDAGIYYKGLEISTHCYMTRACEGVIPFDICDAVWNIDTHPSEPSYDLCFSIATLEHIPEQFIPRTIQNMKAHCKRGLHGVDFGANDDGFDKTHTTLKPKEWWQQQFARYAPGWPVEILDKEELERGEIAREVLTGDGKLKVNVGSFTTMFHNGWLNVDVHDLAGFAQNYKYQYLRADIRNGMPFGTGTVDLFFMSHMLEHLSYEEGLKFLRDCRRCIRKDGAMRILVPDAELLMDCYTSHKQGDRETVHFPPLSKFDEISDGCQKAPTAAGKLWELLHSGHQSCYDFETMENLLKDAGFRAIHSLFRQRGDTNLNPNSPVDQIIRETVDMFPSLSLVVDAYPA